MLYTRSCPKCRIGAVEARMSPDEGIHIRCVNCGWGPQKPAPPKPLGHPGEGTIDLDAFIRRAQREMQNEYWCPACSNEVKPKRFKKNPPFQDEDGRLWHNACAMAYGLVSARQLYQYNY